MIEKCFNMIPYTYGNLLSDYEEVYRYILNNPKEIKRKITEQIVNFYKIIDKELKDKVVAGFGLGYPFYDDYKYPKLLTNIDQYHKDLYNKILAINHKKPFNCVSCVEQNGLNKEMCKNCSEPLKPRGLFKALLDLDIVIVVDKINQGIKEEIAEIAKKNNYRQSDLSIYETIQRFVYTTKNGKSEIPLDLHIVTNEDLNNFLIDNIGKRGENSVKYSALYNNWVDGQMPLYVNLLFSATFLGEIKDEELRENLEKFYKNYFKDKRFGDFYNRLIPNDRIDDILSNLGPVLQLIDRVGVLKNKSFYDINDYKK